MIRRTFFMCMVVILVVRHIKLNKTHTINHLIIYKDYNTFNNNQNTINHFTCLFLYKEKIAVLD